jgi:chromate reductase, NAD(P)H dehydrogenase (quinone)
MTRILGLSGSLRKQSYNTAILRAAAELLEGASLEMATLHGIPLYDGDAEDAHGIPEAVKTLKAKIRDADGLLIATPEYNGSMPGVLKNALDWLSRPPGERPDVFAGRPVAVIGASPGGFGTMLAQASLWPVLRNLGAQPWWGQKLLFSRVHQLVDSEGRLSDVAAREQLRGFVNGFATQIKSR